MKLRQSNFLRRSVTVCATTLVALVACLPSALAKSHAEPSAAAGPMCAASDKHDWVSSTTVIKAAPSEVWKTIHEERLKDPDLSYSKVLEQTSPTEYKLEQKFNFIPVIGSSVCVMQQREVPNERIDYNLLKSDRFKAMEGSWVLTPCDEGRHTKLELSSHLDLGLPVPRPFMNGITSKKIQKRLANIKDMAERSNARVASKDHKISE